jgi:hypothetical protein
MQIDYEITERDFYDGLIASRNSKRFNYWLVLLVKFFAGIMLLLYLVLIISSHGTVREQSTLLNLRPLAFLCVFWLIILYAGPWYYARKQYRSQPAVQGKRTLIADNESLSFHGEGIDFSANWNKFIRYSEGRTVFNLYTSSTLFQVIPKRRFTKEELAEFRELLSCNVSGKQR